MVEEGVNNMQTIPISTDLSEPWIGVTLESLLVLQAFMVQFLKFIFTPVMYI